MDALTSVIRDWEVRPTLRLSRLADQALLAKIDEELRNYISIASANIGFVRGEQSEGITATIVLAEPTTLAVAIIKAIDLLAEACAAAGLKMDSIVEVVAQPGGVDPRTLL